MTYNSISEALSKLYETEEEAVRLAEHKVAQDADTLFRSITGRRLPVDVTLKILLEYGYTIVHRLPVGRLMRNGKPLSDIFGVSMAGNKVGVILC